METRRRRNTDVREFARRVILSEEYQPTLKRRVLAGQISRDFAKMLLGYARGPDGNSEEMRWLAEPAALLRLERIARGEREHEA
jgi:hypothetical protein